MWISKSCVTPPVALVFIVCLFVFTFPFRYRLQTVRSLAGVSLMLRLLWACLRWDDMAVKPSASVGTTRKGEGMLSILISTLSLSCPTFDLQLLLSFVLFFANKICLST